MIKKFKKQEITIIKEGNPRGSFCIMDLHCTSCYGKKDIDSYDMLFAGGAFVGDTIQYQCGHCGTMTTSKLE